MLVTLLLSNGSRQTVDVAEVHLDLGASPLELSLEAPSTRLRLYSPGTTQRWQRFVVHHSAANAMSLEVVAEEQDCKSTAGCDIAPG
jgi:hypothetical protein